MRTLLPITLLLLGCSTFAEEAHRKISNALDCPQAQVEIEEVGDKTYRARGCGYRAVYRCERRVHKRAGGARYVACRRVEAADLGSR